MQGIIFRKKTYVCVDAHIDTDGKTTPLTIYWEDGRSFSIDRVISRTKKASHRVGGFGLCFAIEVCGKRTQLWQDHQGLWYVEEIVPGKAGALL